MDAEQTDTPAAEARTTRTVRIADRTISMYVPKQGQLLALKMASSAQLGDDAKLTAVTEMFLSLFVADADRTWFFETLAAGGLEFEAISASINAIVEGAGGAKPKAKPKAKVRTVYPVTGLDVADPSWQPAG